jgi:hypothetical protein
MGPGVTSDTVEGLGAPLTAGIVAVGWGKAGGGGSQQRGPARLPVRLPRIDCEQTSPACHPKILRLAKPGRACQNLGPETVESIVKSLGPQFTGEAASALLLVLPLPIRARRRASLQSASSSASGALVLTAC